MYRYETLFVQHSDLPEAQVRETNDRVRRLIEGMGGQVIELQDWGIRDLAYPIRKQSRGTYVLVQYTALPTVVNELERTLRIADEILRFVSVRMPEKKKAAAPASKRPRPGAAREAEGASSPE